MEEWKKANDIDGNLVVREYTVIKEFRVRDGVVGPQQELSGKNIGEVYFGGGQQYEFIDYVGNGKWEEYLTISNRKGIIIK